MTHNTLPPMRFVRGKPYFLHAVVWDRHHMHSIASKYRSAHYYYTKIIHATTGKNGYALYLDKKVVA